MIASHAQYCGLRDPAGLRYDDDMGMNCRGRVAIVAAFILLRAQGWAEEKPLYDESADARADIRSAVARAKKEHRNVILDFGANWCLDCHVLEKAMEQAELAGVIEKSFVVVHIDVGRFDKNVDVADQHHVRLDIGIPAVAILDSNGKLLAQDQGQLEDARHMSFGAIKAFFELWKPKK
jgi:thiol:disulfide interchange protein